MFSNKTMLQTRMLLATRNRLAANSHKAMFAAAVPVRNFSAHKDNFMSGANANYIDQMYTQWTQDPSSVHASWNAYFAGGEGSYQGPPTLGQQPGQFGDLAGVLAALKSAGGAAGSDTNGEEMVRLHMLLRSYMTHGHLIADIDPLNLKEVYKDSPSLAKKFRFPDAKLLALLDPSHYGFTEADMEREFAVSMPYNGTIAQRKQKWKLRELLQAYREAYCDKIGVQFMHIQDRDVCNWIREKFESIQFREETQGERVHMYERLNWAHQWGAFMAGKFNTMKRFGLEGCESFVPGLKFCIDSAVEEGARTFVIGMAHRGRLNTLANVVRKPMEVIMAEFQGITPKQGEETINASAGDVKYHLGTTFRRRYGESGHEIKLTLMANPSHLEAVNPLVAGRCRAEQHFLGGKKEDREKVVPIVVHGDAAVAGQGIVYECLQMEQLQNYTVGGTIHVVINNQVGFTTTPDRARSSTYCSEVATAISAPIFHVNAHEMDDVANTFRIAAQYRQKFGRDVVIDLVGYRKMGHNELDQPSYTQPLMYAVVKNMNPVRNVYRQKLIDEGIPEETLKEIDDRTQAHLNDAYQKSKNLEFDAEDWVDSKWEEIKDPQKYGKMKDTGIDLDDLRAIGNKITDLPPEGNFHPKIAKIFVERQKSINEGVGIDWGTAESLAFATLINEGNHVRISGQDVERGTFSHRHAHVFHQDRDGCYVPINAVSPDNSVRNFIASNSHLSEYAVLGFEQGYAQSDPNTLCLWEAQFGDFANGAQIMIDQFITSGESKWNVKSGLVMLLPHGYDGAGPEHSSSRIERFLQLSDANDEPPAEDMPESQIAANMNFSLAQCTTAAQFFHLLRRQIRRPFRKPLVVPVSKKLLKYRGANSKIEEFAKGLRFQRVIEELSTELVADAQIKKVLLCSGQIYYDLEAERTKRGINDVAIVRIEQIAPFPFRYIEPSLKRYTNAKVEWVQEEPKNQGAWSFVEPRMRNLLKKLNHQSTDATYSGRKISPTTATGYGKQHTLEIQQLMESAFTV